jgi:branched-chain amino acid transport system permease protein
MIVELEQALASGLGTGAIYGTLAVGLTLIFYVNRMIQVAHGQVLMIGAYVGVYCINDIGGGSLIGGVLTFLGCLIIGLLVERLLLRPFQGRYDDYPVIVITIALGLLADEIVRLKVNQGLNVQYPLTGILTRIWQVGTFQVEWASVFALALLVLFAGGAHLLIRRSRAGLAMRSMASNIETAQLLGVRVGRVAAWTVGVASGMAGVAGMLAGFQSGSIDPTFGDLIGLKALAVALFVGLGNVGGAAAGGIVLGIAEALVTTYTNGSYQDAIAFAMIIVVLIVRPAGLFGSPPELIGET